MALTLDTNHPLYPNIIFCIGVDGGALVELRHGVTTFTPAAGTGFGTGTYGEHFQSARTDNFTPLGATLAPALEDDTSTSPQQSCFMALNVITYSGGAGGLARISLERVNMSADSSTGFAEVSGITGTNSTTAIVNNGAISTGYNRDAQVGGSTFVNGVKESTYATRLKFNSSDKTDYIMGAPGQGVVNGQLVWFVKFNRQLTDQEMLDLHNSLGANNQFALVTAGAPVVTPIAFTGTIPSFNFTTGDAASVDLSTYFSGTETPFSFANTGTALTGSGLTLSSTGLLSGTATESSITGVIVTGTDTATNTAASNAFNITVAAAAQVPQGTVTIGTITAGETTASVPFTYSAADETGYVYRLNGGTPVAVGASPISLTGLTANTAYTIDVAATNATGTGTYSAVANFTTDAVATNPTFTSEPLKDNTGALLVSAALDYVALYDNITGALVLRVTGLSTNAGGVFSVENAALTTGVTYKADWKVTSQAQGRMPAKAAV